MASEEGQRDNRGVKRGACKMCGCDGYDRGSEGKKCEGCGHPPGKHESLSPQLSRGQAIQSYPTSPPSRAHHEMSMSSVSSLDLSGQGM